MSVIYYIDEGTIFRKIKFLFNDLQSIATQDGDKLKIETTVKDTLKLTRVYEFTDTDMTVVSKIY